jgi:hypothetical protein
MTARWKALYASWELDLDIARLRREEAAALAQAGRKFRTASLEPAAEPGQEPSNEVTRALAGVAELEERVRVLTERLVASLEADRRDYRGTGSDLGRWLIIARGVLDRLVLRDESTRARRDLPARQAELGAAILGDPAALARLPQEDRERALAARSRLERAQAGRTALLAPYGGDALPGWMRASLEELGTFGVFLREELTKKIYLRLPALAAMAAAWWITAHFTSSRFESNLNRFTGEGRTGLSEAALEQLQFWLPLVVAAMVAYVVASLSKRVRRRYLGEDGKGQAS